jgi:hypothetical protein
MHCSTDCSGPGPGERSVLTSRCCRQAESCAAGEFQSVRHSAYMRANAGCGGYQLVREPDPRDCLPATSRKRSARRFPLARDATAVNQTACDAGVLCLKWMHGRHGALISTDWWSGAAIVE